LRFRGSSRSLRRKLKRTVSLQPTSSLRTSAYKVPTSSKRLP
jgi:hypothetical protein